MWVTSRQANPASPQRLSQRAQASGGEGRNACTAAARRIRTSAAKFHKRMKKTPAHERERLFCLYALFRRSSPRGYFLSERPFLSKAGVS